MRKKRTSRFIAALLIITKTWNQPKCPTDAWLTSATKNKMTVICRAMNDLESSILGKVSQTQRRANIHGGI